jgi:hypothetical protein
VYNYNRDGVIQYYGGLFDLICALINTISPLDEYVTRHLLNAWAGFLALFFAVKISRRILGEQAAINYGMADVFIAFFFRSLHEQSKGHSRLQQRTSCLSIS